MGHKQTKEHRSGKGSYHQVGLVRGQFGDINEKEWITWLHESRFDGWEEASWELNLSRCGNDTDAEAYARERLQLTVPPASLVPCLGNLGIFSVAAHLQGQALGDEVSAKTLQFLGGESVAAYADWRTANSPPRTDPYFVPPHVAEIARRQATQSLINAVRLAHFLGKFQDRVVPVSGFVGSPASCWSHWFRFPPLPSTLGGFPIPDVFAVSLELLVERFAPVFQACLDYGTTHDLECHPSERAMGDLASAEEYLKAVDKAGFAKAAGFNFDRSHMEWQGVSGIEFIRAFGDRIHCVHIKGVQVVDGYTRNGLLGGHRPMGDPHNGWNFVTAGTARDATDVEETLIELNRVGYDGAVSIEWEDNDANKKAGALAALANVRKADLPPSGVAHDAQLKA